MPQLVITTCAVAALSIVGISSVAGHRLDHRADAQIDWKECNKTLVATDLPSECANFTVPLDYTTPSDERTIELQIARVKARVQPSKGTILINFGGPGSPGRSSLAQNAGLLKAYAVSLRLLSSGDERLAC
jgi:hypothetical protein